MQRHFCQLRVPTKERELGNSCAKHCLHESGHPAHLPNHVAWDFRHQQLFVRLYQRWHPNRRERYLLDIRA